jgi:hypothetical protein
VGVSLRRRELAVPANGMHDAQRRPTLRHLCGSLWRRSGAAGPASPVGRSPHDARVLARAPALNASRAASCGSRETAPTRRVAPHGLPSTPRWRLPRDR